MSRIKNRLRSRRGASITFALLLFLVCAVLSSVIIVAATAAAGRIAGMAEADQRYYAVTSASELLKDLISGKTVTVATVTKSSTGENTYLDGVIQGTASSDLTNDSGYPIVYVVNGSADGMSADELDSASSLTSTSPIRVTKIEGTTKLPTILENAAYRYCSGKANSLSFPLPSSSFTLSSTTEEDDPLSVSITESILQDGSVTLTVSKDSFQQQLVFSCTVSDSSASTTSDEVTQTTVTNTNHIQTTVKTHKTEVTTKKMTWTLTGVNSIGGGT